ncbi:MAG: 3-deoxy-8-phosphooctulonate synthase [Burkholderiales bacterium]|jgi:2-dehydro-3-deoxyphosphooctonate aldolase (KDO 8-P synthase)|nr:3-deoxy-8-phosphooctulonate synthase [Burkholderiales bacterium]
MNIGDFFVGLNEPIFVIAGPCVIESEDSTLAIARALKEMGEALGMPIIFKASYDKANRSSNDSFRGLGVDRGLEVLSLVKEKLGMPILTDVHSIGEVERVASVVDVLQTPAFLCRQTDFIRTVAATGLPVNIKKGQFLSPNEMQEVVKKAKNASGVDNILVCERGASFGYNNLISDMRSLAIMRNTNCPVVFDATHSVQLPGARGNASGGQREFVPVLARSAVAAGISGIFMETHPDPEQALSDGPNAWPLDRMEKLLKQIKQIDELVKATPFQEMDLNSTTN